MQSVRWLPIVVIAVLAVSLAVAQAATPAPLTLSTTAFPDGGQIPVQFTAAADGITLGEGTSPPLAWVNPPAGTESFVLHMHDIDVVRNGTTDDQLHWLVWNIPATAAGLPEGVQRESQLPDGSYQISATGPMYRGPSAPATGPLHHYVLELYALDIVLNIHPTGDAFATRTDVLATLQGHILGKAVYVGFFRRPG